MAPCEYPLHSKMKCAIKETMYDNFEAIKVTETKVEDIIRKNNQSFYIYQSSSII